MFLYEDRIHEASAGTFHSITLDHESQLNSWLRSERPALWISGKAGSGKTTFMKHICQNEITYRQLTAWAAGAEVVTAKFFFFERGDDLQKSRDGLLRSLLFQILSKCKSLVPVIFKPEWATATRAGASISRAVSSMDWWGLHRRFTELLGELGKQKKLCLFIDGIDEHRTLEDMLASMDDDLGPTYQTDVNEEATGEIGHWISESNQEIADLLKDWAAAKNIKICLSSRPFNTFEAEFSTFSRIRLQELTADGIATYCRDELLAPNPLFGPRQQTEMHDLVNEIVDKAQGVWLWVAIVVKRFKHGIRNGDSPHELRKQLQQLPPQLAGRNGLYMKMLSLIEPGHRQQAARLFKLALNAWKPLDLLDMSFAEESLTNHGTVTDMQRNEHDLVAVTTPFAFLQESDVSPRELQMEARLRSRCAGLLEASQLAADESWLHFNEVGFMHQTAKNFLSNTQIWKTFFPAENLDPFDSQLALLSACILKLKTYSRTLATYSRTLAMTTTSNDSQASSPEREFTNNNFSAQYAYVQNAIAYAKSVERREPYRTYAFKLLDELDTTMTRLFGLLTPRPVRRLNHWTSAEPFAYEPGKLDRSRTSPLAMQQDQNILRFVSFVMEGGLVGYEGHRLASSL